jgi:hypothetical protein
LLAFFMSLLSPLAKAAAAMKSGDMTNRRRRSGLNGETVTRRSCGWLAWFYRVGVTRAISPASSSKKTKRVVNGQRKLERRGRKRFLRVAR